MLTKDLLKYTNKSGRVYPHRMKASDPKSIAVCEKIISAMGKCQGAKQADLKQRMDDSLGSLNQVQQGLQKLLFDVCKFSDPDSMIETNRWKAILAGEDLRRDNIYASETEYRARLAEVAGSEMDNLEEELYADLPEFKRVQEYKAMSPMELLHRYNCAQIQGLLLNAKEIKLQVDNATIAEKRTLFRALKFHQIIAHSTNHEGSSIQIELSGPLSIFSGSSSYGLRIANFFPHILHLKKFTLEAMVKVKRDLQKLIVSNTDKIESHYRNQQAFIPAEFTTVVSEFNNKQKDYMISISGDLIDLGRQIF